MPVRRRLGRVAALDVPTSLFSFGDGTWSYFNDEKVYPNREVGRRAWRQCRREVWATENASDIPGAAREYDGLTRSGFAHLWSHWNHRTFSLDDALDAIEQDRVAVQVFQQRDPRGARPIADFLGIWLTYLDRLESIARELAALSEMDRYRSGLVNRMSTGRTYADVLRGVDDRRVDRATRDEDVSGDDDDAA